VEFVGVYDGRYWLKVWNRDPGPRSGAPGYNPSYNLTAVEVLGTITPCQPPFAGTQLRFIPCLGAICRLNTP